MIVPRPRLLLWFAVIVLPLAVVASVLPGATLPALAGIAAFAVLLAFDAWGASAALAGVSVELPAVVRLQREREGAVEARVHNRGGRRRTVRFGLVFPREITCEGEEILAELPDGNAYSALHWTCRPTQRGQFVLAQYFLGAVSRLKFWDFRAARQTACELRVYPNFLDERRHVAALFLNRGHAGIHAQHHAGKGRDFEKLRDYIPGDSYDEISWKASAKRGRPVTKVFQVERTQEVYIVLDASRLMARASADFERYITAGLLLGIAAEQQGDSFGMIAFSDQVLHFARAKTGKAQFEVCRDMFYALQPQRVTPDFDVLASFIRTTLRKRALLVFLTALDDPALGESFLPAMDLICRQHLILVNMLRPARAQPLFAGAAVAGAEEIYARLAGHLLWQDLRETGQVLQRRGVKFSLLERETLSARLVTQYMNVKARQLL